LRKRNQACIKSHERISYLSNKVSIKNAGSEDIHLVLGATQAAYDFFLSYGYPEQYCLEIIFQLKK